MDFARFAERFNLKARTVYTLSPGVSVVAAAAYCGVCHRHSDQHRCDPPDDRADLSQVSAKGKPCWRRAVPLSVRASVDACAPGSIPS